jgi:hypothetical protein
MGWNRSVTRLERPVDQVFLAGARFALADRSYARKT